MLYEPPDTFSQLLYFAMGPVSKNPRLIVEDKNFVRYFIMRLGYEVGCLYSTAFRYYTVIYRLLIQSSVFILHNSIMISYDNFNFINMYEIIINVIIFLITIVVFTTCNYY